MMELSLLNFNAELPKDLLKKAGKLTVRECDETVKGNFVAYVDEQHNSYDVSVQTNTAGLIESYNCECRKAAIICPHIAALLIQIVNRNPKKKVKKNTAGKNIEALLDSIDQIALKTWLHELLLKNKDMAFAFTHHFSVQENDYNPAGVRSLTEDAAKSIVKNKKQIDLTQLKKVISIWTDIHAPIVQYYMANTADKDAFLNFHELLEACFAFHVSININSSRIPGYIKNLLDKSVAAIHEIINEKSWLKAINYFIEYVSDENGITRLQYVYHLRHIFTISEKERKSHLLELLGISYKAQASKKGFNSDEFTKVFFAMVKELEAFEDYYKDIKPITFDNEFNVQLIELLIEHKHFSRAIEHCEKQIAQNFREEYNIPYLRLLKKIYSLQENKMKLLRILEALLPHSFDLNDFIFVNSQIENQDEQKKFRTKILSRAKQLSPSNSAAMSFIFSLASHEKNYKKMIGYIDSYTPYKLIVDYFEPMSLTDKTTLLNAIIHKGQDYSWNFNGNSNKEEDELCYVELAEKMVKCYTHDYLRMVMGKQKTITYYNSNEFVDFLKGHLINTG